MQNTLYSISSRALTSRLLLIGLACVALIGIPALVQRIQEPVIVYQPIDACTLFTEDATKELLGQTVINRRTAPEINTDTNVATSKCSYSDTNENNFSVAAVAIQTGIDDSGSKRVSNDFGAFKKANQTEPVEGIAKDAFYVPVNGQIHTVDDHHWYIFSRSQGDNLSAANKETAIEFAKSVLANPKV